MKSSLAIFCLTLAIFLGGISGAFALPNCFGSPTSNWFKVKGDAFSSGWSSCVGVYTDKNGNKYSGEWKDSKMHGRGTLTHASGKVEVGIWKEGRFTRALPSSVPSVKDVDELATADPSVLSRSELVDIEKRNSKERKYPDWMYPKGTPPIERQRQKIIWPRGAAKKIQAALREQGLYSGSLDGALGVRSQKAIKHWQEANNYLITGDLSQKQYFELTENTKQPPSTDYTTNNVSSSVEGISPSRSSGTEGILASVSDAFSTLGEWVAIISGWISSVSLVLWLLMLSTLKSDGRTTTGYKDNATEPGCFLPLSALIAGGISYFTNENAFFTHLDRLLN